MNNMNPRKHVGEDPLNKFNSRVKFSSNDEMMPITEAVMNGENT